MALFQIPLIATPSQTLSVQLGQQSCRINVRQRRTGLFIDLYLQDVPIALGVKALNLRFLVREAYLGFIGDLYFIDTMGADDPDFTGLASRFLFVWDEDA
jgi:hypothetical protein